MLDTSIEEYRYAQSLVDPKIDEKIDYFLYAKGLRTENINLNILKVGDFFPLRKLVASVFYNIIISLMQSYVFDVNEKTFADEKNFLNSKTVTKKR